MRYNTLINNVKAHEWGLDIKQAYLFAWMYELASWADKAIIENKTYYFASKNKACEELPLLTDKRDTMYRYYKKLESANLIELKKIGDKDYIRLTNKGKCWNQKGPSEHSDKNPSNLGKKSDPPSDKNPTYNVSNSNNINKDNDDFSEKDDGTLNAYIEKAQKLNAKERAILQLNDRRYYDPKEVYGILAKWARENQSRWQDYKRAWNLGPVKTKKIQALLFHTFAPWAVTTLHRMPPEQLMKKARKFLIEANWKEYAGAFVPKPTLPDYDKLLDS